MGERGVQINSLLRDRRNEGITSLLKAKLVFTDWMLQKPTILRREKCILVLLLL
jgi:hypothetical protein